MYGFAGKKIPGEIVKRVQKVAAEEGLSTRKLHERFGISTTKIREILKENPYNIDPAREGGQYE